MLHTISQNWTNDLCVLCGVISFMPFHITNWSFWHITNEDKCLIWMLLYTGCPRYYDCQFNRCSIGLFFFLSCIPFQWETKARKNDSWWPHIKTNNYPSWMHKSWRFAEMCYVVLCCVCVLKRHQIAFKCIKWHTKIVMNEDLVRLSISRLCYRITRLHRKWLTELTDLELVQSFWL